MPSLREQATPTDPLREARERAGAGYEVRILEPAPPALSGNADDPTERGVVPPGAKLLGPVTGADVTWAELAADDQDLSLWAADRWLVPHGLPEMPDTLVGTRLALHRVAEEVVMPARRDATGGEIALRYTHGGFGTPFFGDDRQVRVDGAEIVEQCNAAGGRHVRRERIRSLRDAASVVSGLVDPESLSDEPLAIDEGAARSLGDWFGFGTLVIAELRARAGVELEPASINLWPEHFDVATELGAEAAGQRAGYGASPGDEEHPEPYLYVGPWDASPEGALWNATAFAGAELSYSELVGSADPVAHALEFFETRLSSLTS